MVKVKTQVKTYSVHSMVYPHLILYNCPCTCTNTHPHMSAHNSVTTVFFKCNYLLTCFFFTQYLTILSCQSLTFNNCPAPFNPHLQKPMFSTHKLVPPLKTKTFPPQGSDLCCFFLLDSESSSQLSVFSLCYPPSHI